MKWMCFLSLLYYPLSIIFIINHPLDFGRSFVLWPFSAPIAPSSSNGQDQICCPLVMSMAALAACCAQTAGTALASALPIARTAHANAATARGGVAIFAAWMAPKCQTQRAGSADAVTPPNQQPIQQQEQQHLIGKICIIFAAKYSQCNELNKFSSVGTFFLLTSSICCILCLSTTHQQQRQPECPPRPVRDVHQLVFGILLWRWRRWCRRRWTHFLEEADDGKIITERKISSQRPNGILSGEMAIDDGNWSDGISGSGVPPRWHFCCWHLFLWGIFFSVYRAISFHCWKMPKNWIKWKQASKQIIQ